MTPKIIMDIFDIINIKAGLVFDRINAKKSTIMKFDSLEKNPDKILLHEQPMQTAGLLTAVGTSFIMINQWSIRPEDTMKAMSYFFKMAGEDNYLAACLAKYKEDRKGL